MTLQTCYLIQKSEIGQHLKCRAWIDHDDDSLFSQVIIWSIKRLSFRATQLKPHSTVFFSKFFTMFIEKSGAKIVIAQFIAQFENFRQVYERLKSFEKQKLWFCLEICRISMSQQILSHITFC